MPEQHRGLAAELVVAGEALIDLMTAPDGTVKPVLGGSPFNLALALGRLGCNVAYRSPLSTDPWGQQLADALLSSGVVLSGGRIDRPTSLATVRLDANGEAIYRFEREGVADRSLAPLSPLDDWPPTCRFFHVGSLALIPPDGDAWCELLRELRHRGVSTSVDVNMRPKAASDATRYAATARAVAAQAHWLKVSDEDLQAMGLHGDPCRAAASLLNDTTRAALLTLGAQGSWCFHQHGELFQPAEPVQALDTVGAGDCFYAGFLACLDEAGALHAPPDSELLGQALRMGSRAAAINIQRAGCQPPWRRELAGS